MGWRKHLKSWVVTSAIVLLPVVVQGQTSLGSATMNGAVSETVALSVSQNVPQGNVRISSQGDAQALTLTLTGSGSDAVTIRVPIQIRSNTSYTISALVHSEAATLANLSVLDARPMGKFVAPDAVANLKVAREVDSQTTNGQVQTASPDSFRWNLSSPLPILSGPRVSLAGTLTSRDNALEVTILIAVRPDAGTDTWLMSLTISGSPGESVLADRQCSRC